MFGTTSFALDAAGNRTKLTFPSAAGRLVVTDTYDSLNRLMGAYQGAASAASRVVGYGYDILGRRSTASYGSSSAAVASTAIGYTNADLPRSLTHTWNGASIGLGYGYNADRQKTSVSATDGQFLPSGLAASTASYTANNLNQYTAIGSAAPTSFYFFFQAMKTRRDQISEVRLCLSAKLLTVRADVTFSIAFMLQIEPKSLC